MNMVEKKNKKILKKATIFEGIRMTTYGEEKARVKYESNKRYELVRTYGETMIYAKFRVAEIPMAYPISEGQRQNCYEAY